MTSSFVGQGRRDGMPNWLQILIATPSAISVRSKVID